MPTSPSAQRDARATRFLDALVTDLEPVRPGPPWRRAVLGWTLVSWVVVGLAFDCSGPLHLERLATLGASPLCTIETLLGIATGVLAIAAGLEIGVPGTPSPARWAALSLLVFASWLGVAVYAEWHPVDAPLSVASRPHCVLELLAFATPPLLVGLRLARRRSLSHPMATGFLIAMAATAIPALWMQFVCLGTPRHGVLLHLLPIVGMGAVGAGIGWLVLRQR